MIASAYEFAQSGGAIPRELILARYIDRFGAQAVFGRPIGAGEAHRIMIAEAVVRAYKNPQRAENAPAFAREHPEEAALLLRAAEAASDGE